MPNVINLTISTIGGQAFSTYYTNTRLVAFGYKFTYIGAEDTSAGEFCVAFCNVNPVIVAGANVKTALRDMQFYCTGRAEEGFQGIWIPQDNADFELRNAGDVADADKTNTGWGVIAFAGTGFPVNVSVYHLEIVAISEGIVNYGFADFIPQALSPAISSEDCLLLLKRCIIERPEWVCRSMKENCAPRGCRRGGDIRDAEGGMTDAERYLDVIRIDGFTENRQPTLTDKLSERASNIGSEIYQGDIVTGKQIGRASCRERV